MTLSRLEQSRRLIVKAAKATAEKREHYQLDERSTDAQIVEAIEEEIAWDFSEEEAWEALKAYQAALS